MFYTLNILRGGVSSTVRIPTQGHKHCNRSPFHHSELAKLLYVLPVADKIPTESQR
jgi:hypothetical protein